MECSKVRRYIGNARATRTRLNSNRSGWNFSSPKEHWLKEGPQDHRVWFMSISWSLCLIQSFILVVNICIQTCWRYVRGGIIQIEQENLNCMACTQLEVAIQTQMEVDGEEPGPNLLECWTMTMTLTTILR